jgi:4-hydroxy-3-methylbut-2-enyl diphosphate reductase
MVTIIQAKSAGFCYGVRRAINICEEQLKFGACYILGQLVHNKRVIAELEAKGLHTAESIEDIPDGSRVIIRSHGEPKSTYAALAAKRCEIIDATCPDVSKIHGIVADASEQGRTVLIFGDANHPEVKASCGWAKKSFALENAENWEKFDEPLTVVCQTTANKPAAKNFCEKLKKSCTNLIICDTICNATSLRQEEALKLSNECDAMVVVGDKNSSNANQLAEICKSVNSRTLFVECSEEIEALDGFNLRIGLTAGASTPDGLIEEVKTTMETKKIEILGADGAAPATEATAIAEETPTLDAAVIAEEEVSTVPAEEAPTAEATEEAPAAEAAEEASAAKTVEEAPAAEAVEETPVAEAVEETPAAEVAEEAPAGTDDSFVKLLDENFKTLRTGETVSGVVTSISPTEITVDLGTKQSGYIPITEISDDANADINELVKIGDTVEAYVMRVNDVEGVITLSKKRLDISKNWDGLENAVNSREIFEGTVVEENKGGVVVALKGYRVFVPASQSGLAKDVPMSTLLHKKVKLRVTEATKAKRRVVGSIRAVQNELRRENVAKLWSEIEIGKVYQGKVKTLTSFGAFVDIGGVDGMAHVSSLSWGRIKHPSDVLKEGDEIEVYITNVDREKKKISLGYRKLDENPWLKFTENYREGDIIEVKVNKLTQFGAFAEIIKHVDGLIHISQIADHRVEKASDVLSEGEIVRVRITQIDYERQKVSLSIRSVDEDWNPPSDDDTATDEQ